MPVRVASGQRELEQVIEEMNDGGERDGLLDWKEQGESRQQQRT